jgi:hypothetical protein
VGLVSTAVALLALALAPTARAAGLSVTPRDFSPTAGLLSVQAELPAPGRVGVRLASDRGRILGWLEPPARRRAVDVEWDGRIAGKLVREGYYRVELVAGRKVIGFASLHVDMTAPSLEDLRVGTDARFAGDRRLLATVTPNGDGQRDYAVVRFTLSEPALVSLDVMRTLRTAQSIATQVYHFRRGQHAVAWAPPPGTPARTYVLSLDAIDSASNLREYGALTAFTNRYRRGPVVRVLGVDASFSQPSYAPGQRAFLRIASDAPELTMQIFRVGGEEQPTYLANELSGLPIAAPIVLPWLRYGSAPRTIHLRVGAWRSGLYYALLQTPDGQKGYAPFVVRPALLGFQSRIAVILPTTTWQAYNQYDENGDGWGDTWYAGGRPDRPVLLGRPFLNRGVPPFFTRYDIGFQTWLARAHKTVDFLAESDLDRVRTGADLARAYDLVVYPGHTEYVPDHEYNVIEQFRDAGGNLIFLSANNFFWRVQRHGKVLRRTALWRDLGRPEARLVGVQYRANDEGDRQGFYIVRSAQTAPWLWAGTGLIDDSSFGEFIGGYGIEIDTTTADSPPGTIVLADIPDLFGPGLTPQMAYYETPRGARVFAAGTLDFGGSVYTWPVRHILDNLWARLSVP